MASIASTGIRSLRSDTLVTMGIYTATHGQGCYFAASVAQSRTTARGANEQSATTSPRSQRCQDCSVRYDDAAVIPLTRFDDGRGHLTPAAAMTSVSTRWIARPKSLIRSSTKRARSLVSAPLSNVIVM